MPASIGRAGCKRALSSGWSLFARNRRTCAEAIITAVAHIAAIKFVPSTLAGEDVLSGNDFARYQGDRHTIARRIVSGAVRPAVSIHPRRAETFITNASIKPSGTQAAR